MKKSKWSGVLRVLIVIFALILILNSFMFFRELKRDVTYSDRSYGLDVLNEYFNNGQYYQIYEATIKNKYSNDRPEIDVSQYEAFGRYYNAYLQAMADPGNSYYRQLMENEKKNITCKKIINVMTVLENNLNS